MGNGKVAKAFLENSSSFSRCRFPSCRRSVYLPCYRICFTSAKSENYFLTRGEHGNHTEWKAVDLGALEGIRGSNNPGRRMVICRILVRRNPGTSISEARRRCGWGKVIDC